MYKAIISSLLLCVLVKAPLAQDQETDPYIEVTGSAEMEVTPDVIVYTVVLREYERDRKLVSIEDIEGGFLVAVNASGIKEENIRISDISASAFNTKRKRKAFASKTYELTFGTPKELRAFTDRLENLDIQHQRISKVTHSQLSEFRLEVKKQALLAAKNKAKALLSVVESKLGKPLLIREISDIPFNPSTIYANRSFKMEEAINSDEIGFKQIKLRFEIQARFRID